MVYFYTVFLPQCSVSCGGGVRNRELRCAERDPHGGFTEFPIRKCRNVQKPHTDLQQACNKVPCPAPQPHIPPPGPGRASGAMALGWYSSPWQQVQLLHPVLCLDLCRCMFPSVRFINVIADSLHVGITAVTVIIVIHF